MNSRSPRSRSHATPLPGRLRTVTPEAFEKWVGERFESQGYAVLRTPFRGDHGIDLKVERQGERAIVQCKHWPARSVGERVVRELYGALHDSGAQRAYLVTTGNVTPATRKWAKDKPIDFWDWQHLIEKWPTEITELAARTSAAAEASSDIRPGWYVYVDDLNSPWAIKLPKSVGEHPLLGFQPLRDPNLGVVPKLVKLRHVNIFSTDWRNGRPKQRSLPIATEKHRLALLQRATPDFTLELPTLDGGTDTWRISNAFAESGAYNPRVRKRAARAVSSQE